MDNRGIRLRKFLNAGGINYVRAAKEIGINKNTIHLWMSREDLEEKNIIRISKTYPEIKEHFPEIDWTNYFVTSSEAAEISHLSDDVKGRLYGWQNKYIHLMNRYNSLLEKYTDLLSDNLDKTNDKH